MNAFQLLKEEHAAILRVLDCLERLRERTVMAGTIDMEVAGKVLDFLKRFADGAHQDAEEEVLFPALLRAIGSGTRPTLEPLIADHHMERRDLEGLRLKLEGVGKGCELSLDRFLAAAQAYVNRLRDHVWWEDEYILPMAERFIGQREQARMVARILAVRRRDLGMRPYDPHAEAERIESALGMTATAATAA